MRGRVAVPGSGDPDEFWYGVRQHVTSWLVVGGFLGLAWLGYTLPRQLDHVLRNQEEQKTQLDSLENQVREHAIRLTRIEAKAQ